MRKSAAWVIIVAVILIAGAAAVLIHKSNTNNSPPAANNSSSQTSNSAGQASSSSNSQPSAGTINIRNMMFTPSQMTVAKGGTVTWTNNDSTTHTVVDDLSNVGGPNSGDIAPGSAYSFTFTKTGSFQYHCTIHPSMRGTIVVK